MVNASYTPDGNYIAVFDASLAEDGVATYNNGDMAFIAMGAVSLSAALCSLPALRC